MPWACCGQAGWDRLAVVTQHSVQIIRKVVRRLGPDEDDGRPREEVILEGSLQEAQELEAEAEHFMKYGLLQHDSLGSQVPLCPCPCPCLRFHP